MEGYCFSSVSGYGNLFVVCIYLSHDKAVDSTGSKPETGALLEMRYILKGYCICWVR